MSKKTLRGPKKYTKPKQTTDTHSNGTSTTPTPEKYQKFPEMDCSSLLPQTQVTYDVSISEFKMLRRNIQSLSVRLVLNFTKLDEDVSSKHLNFAKRANLLEVLGGVPADRALDKNIQDLLQPMFVDVPIADVNRTLAGGKASLRLKLDDKDLHVKMSDGIRTDLMAGRSTVARANVDGTPQWVRLVPDGKVGAGKFRSEYMVTDLGAFLRRPRLLLNSGEEYSVELNEGQVGELRRTGTTVVDYHGSPVTLRSSTSASTMQYDGLLSEPTRDRAIVQEETSVPDEQSLELALYLPWKQQWWLQGYSRGQLLHSLALAPQEESVIEISSWDRRKTETEISTSSEVEQTSEFTEMNKDVFGVLNELKNDNQFTIDTKFSAGVKLAEVVSFDGQASTGFRTAVSESSRTNIEHVREATQKATARLKITRQTKVGETVEVGREEKVTRRVRNSNMCHTLSLHYFETIAHYKISMALDKAAARLCVLVPSPYGGDFSFTKKNIRYYEAILKRVLLQPELAIGFAAAHKLVAIDQLSQAHLLLQVEYPEQTENQDSAAVVKAREDAIKAFQSVASSVGSLEKAAITFGESPDRIVRLIQSTNLTPLLSRQNVFYRERLKELAPRLFSLLTIASKIVSPSETDLQDLSTALSDVSTLDQISEDRMNTPGAERDRIVDIAWIVFEVPWGTIYWETGGPTFFQVDDAGLVAALRTFQKAMATLLQARAGQANELLAEATSRNSQSYTPKEVAEALEQLDALLCHLNQFRSFYRGALLQLMPLDDYLLRIISQFSNLVERRVLGEIDGKLVLPIRANLDARTRQLFNTLITENTELNSLKDSFDIALPTPGLHIESRLGACDACEDYIGDIRSLDVKSRDADLALKKEKLEQEKLETRRYAARLDLEELSDPENKPGLVRLSLDTNKAESSSLVENRDSKP